MGNLSIARKHDQKYYIFPDLTKLREGDYVEVYQGDCFGGKSKQSICVPSFQILREELVEGLGGLEEVARRVARGEKVLMHREKDKQ